MLYKKMTGELSIKLLFLINLLIFSSKGFGFFQMLRPQWGQEVKENVVVHILSKEVPKGSYVGFKINKANLFVIDPKVKKDYLEYVLDSKKVGFPQGKSVLEAVLFTRVGKKTFEKTSHKVLVNINSEWKPNGEKLKYQFPIGNQWVYRYRSYIRPEGPHITTLEPDVKGRVSFSFTNQIKDKVWVEARIFSEKSNEKSVTIRSDEDPSKVIPLFLDKILSFWSQYDVKGNSYFEKISPIEDLSREGITFDGDASLGSFIAYLPLLCDQSIKKDLKGEVSMSNFSKKDQVWQVDQKNMSWEITDLKWFKGHKIVCFKYSDQNDKWEVRWSIHENRPIFWSVTKKLEIKEASMKVDSTKENSEKSEEKQNNTKAYISTEVFELER